MTRKMVLLALCLPLSLPACGGSPEPIKTALRCPALPSDLAAEAKRKPTIKGTAALEVSGWLIGDIKRKNFALIRSIKLYNACRNT